MNIFVGACQQARSAVRMVPRRYFSSQLEPKDGTEKATTANNRTASPKMSHTHSPNGLEKRMLVLCKKYKSIEEIPSLISPEVMERCRNQVRIKVANYMILGTVIGCIIMIISGKQAQGRGESVQKMNMDWHKEYNEKAREEYEAALAESKGKK